MKNNTTGTIDVDASQEIGLKNAIKILPFFFKPHARNMSILFLLGLAYAVLEGLMVVGAYPLLSPEGLTRTLQNLS